jgi:hypothetical protein
MKKEAREVKAYTDLYTARGVEAYRKEEENCTHSKEYLDAENKKLDYMIGYRKKEEI